MHSDKIRLSKVKLNFVIDILMYLCMMVVVGIGFLMEYVLLPGSERHEVYGRNVELSFWSMNRHQWGNIHLIFGFILVFLLLLHVVFHWKLIIAIYRRMVSGKEVRVLLTLTLVSLTLLLAVVPIFLKPTIQEGERGGHSYEGRNTQRYEQRLNVSDNNSESVAHSGERTLDIYGSMTLKEVANKYKINVTELAELIHVPLSKSGERLGRLKKEYGFDMNELRDYVAAKLEKQGK